MSRCVCISVSVLSESVITDSLAQSVCALYTSDRRYYLALAELVCQLTELFRAAFAVVHSRCLGINSWQWPGETCVAIF